jgi:UMF1 family MFS transporter
MKRERWVPIAAWCAYDWAAASFPIIVTTFVFATYFTTNIAENKTLGTYQWANATALAGFIIAFASPLMGAIADYAGHHKRWLLGLAIVCAVSASLLWFAYPQPSAVYFTLTCVVLGTVGFEMASVFYNAFLPRIAPKNYIGRISGWGWGSGYLGGIVALSIVLLVFFSGKISWLNTETAAPVRLCGPFVAVWFTLFALPFFVWVPELEHRSTPLPKAVKQGWRDLIRTLKQLPKEKNIFLYLIAHMFYADGLNTLFAFGGIYAAGTFHLTLKEVLWFGITMNVAAGIGAILLSFMDDLLGSKRTVLLSLVGLASLGVPILFLQDKWWFWGCSLLVSLFVGPVQSASRSLMVRLIHEDASAEMFGLYALSGRVTAFMGPWILGAVTLAYSSQRAGMATVLIFFVVGGLLLLPVRPHLTIASRS